MSSSVEWHHNVCLPTIVSSSDLFDGELFGDELLDIYNSSVDHHDGDVDSNDIPNLLIPDDLHDSKGQVNHSDPNHPGVQVAHAAAAMDDGLGAFRPSTSFNDLTTLLNPSGEQMTTQRTAQVSAPASPISGTKIVKKRKSASSDSSTPKKRGGARGGGRKAMTKKPMGSTVTPVAPAPAPVPPVVPAASPPVPPPQSSPIEASAKSDDDDTPNPLDMEAGPGPSQISIKTTAAPSAPPSTVRVVSVEKVNYPESSRGKVSSSSSDDEDDDEETSEEFTKMAQAAVSNLIASAGKDDGIIRSPDDEKVDTTTEHIKALTGNNWVQACAGAAIGTASVSVISDPKGANNNRARRQNLTADERARQNRDRNREHARNTRLRKKAYVEELKRTLVELVAERDSNEFEKRQSIQREIEQREVRFRVMEELLKLRGRNETNSARWAAILEDGFTLTMPATSYRKMVGSSQDIETEQVLQGVTDSMTDSSLFSNFLQTLGNKPSDQAVTFQYQMDRKNFFMDGCTGLLDWEGVTAGATNMGAKFELKLKGTIRGTFSPASNKLLSAIMTFDSGVVLSQLRKMHGNAFEETLTAAAAQAAASQADAILDSLQMPLVSVPTAVMVPSSSSDSDASSDKGEVSCDESVAESHEFPTEATCATAN